MIVEMVDTTKSGPPGYADHFMLLTTTLQTHYFQDHLIPNSAWKDYSANTNYGYESRETEEKNGSASNGKRSRSMGSQQTLPMSHSPSKPQYYEAGRNGRQQNGANGDSR